jgi:hypothetical protein
MWPALPVGMVPMRRRCSAWSLTLVAGALCALPPRLHAGLFDWILRYEFQVIATTDQSSSGALLRVPTPADPVYYVAVDVGYHDFGAPIPGDKLPAPKVMVPTILRALALSGYLPADDQHPPTQFIAFGWGTLYPAVFSGFLNMPPVQTNRFQMLRFLGGGKLGLTPSELPRGWRESPLPGLTRLDPDAEAIWTVAADQLYVVVLVGFEYPVKERRHPQILWRSNICCTARGFEMADSMPKMLAIAAPYIGHDTPRPVWIKASDQFKPNVQIGNLKLEEYLDSGQLPVVDATSRGAGRRK